MRSFPGATMTMGMVAWLSCSAGAAAAAPLTARDQELETALADGSRRTGLDLLDDHCGPCLLARWEVYTELRATDEAVAAARLAIATKGSREVLTAAYNRLGLSLRRKGDFAAAGAAFHQAIALGGPERQAALANLAVVARDEGRNDEAAAAARQALELPAAGPVLKHPRSLLCNLAEAAAGNDPGEPPLRVGGTVQKPQKLVGPAPEYTEMARKARLTGVVILTAVIDREGCMRQAQVLKGLPMGLDRAALAAAADWVFQPATLDGKPVPVYYTLTVNFQIGTRAPYSLQTAPP